MRVAYLVIATIVSCAPPAPAGAQPNLIGSLESAGSIAQAAPAFAAICLAHPGDARAQKAAARAAKPRAFAPEAGSPPGIESLTAWPLQLSLLGTAQGQVCAVLTPLVEAPAPAAALAELRRRLHLGAGTAAGEQHVWQRGIAGRVQTIAFIIHTQPDSDHVPHPTVELTLTAPVPKVR